MEIGADEMDGIGVQKRVAAAGNIVHGNWGGWGAWNRCPVTCGGGRQISNRACNDPSPSDGGSACSGNSKKFRSCSIDECPVHGNWGGWGAWNRCPVTCGGGRQISNRACNDPSPSDGGSACSGNSKKFRNCAIDECPESLGTNESTFGAILTPIIYNKLPSDVRKNITRNRGNDDWNIESLRTAIKREVCVQVAGQSTGPSNKDLESLPTASFIAETFNGKNGKQSRKKCLFCEESHHPNTCKNVKDVEKTNRNCERKKVCFNCFGSHRVAECEETKLPTDRPVHYIPHHPVAKESSTTPIRIVYDCSCKDGRDDPSLNECLESHPPVMNDITGIFMRFRAKKYATTSDLVKAFLQIQLDEKDRDATRFLWLSDPTNTSSPLITYRFKFVLFGATFSQFILSATLLKHFKENPGNFQIHLKMGCMWTTF
ncbi:Hypothetical predicted protein [Mytilus galloprovincialis]|uniref:Hemicentin-1 n=1 Tax=Mytilus galloprovincialis TaxID=29158 RepID=A0A8B6GL74_MYTGA|nr:Hypothetical predicted protein [Mytilus galloprovincialis]